jgi:hypothetical protein
LITIGVAVICGVLRSKQEFLRFKHLVVWIHVLRSTILVHTHPQIVDLVNNLHSLQYGEISEKITHDL